jgi:hypothetical protein
MKKHSQRGQQQPHGRTGAAAAVVNGTSRNRQPRRLAGPGGCIRISGMRTGLIINFAPSW